MTSGDGAITGPGNEVSPLGESHGQSHADLLNNNTKNNAERPAECWHGMTIVFGTKFLKWRKFFS